jgi:hypothetical protein
MSEVEVQFRELVITSWQAYAQVGLYMEIPYPMKPCPARPADMHVTGEAVSSRPLSTAGIVKRILEENFLHLPCIFLFWEEDYL